MENPLYDQFAESFSAEPLSSLIDSFNAQVGNRGWNSARACHDQALIDELIRRGVDVSAVHQGNATSFAKKVSLKGNALVVNE